MKRNNIRFRLGLLPRLAKIALSCLGLQVALSPGLAQATATAEAAENENVVMLEEFTVSGLLANLIKAEQIKRETNQVTEVINAEDIGKFPDRSMGEALQRIPGVQVSRNNGEVTEVLVRGLPDLATSLNGNEVFTADGRRLSMQDLPVQALESIQVYKTSTADQQEGGIAGLLNAQLRSPFDLPGMVASAYFDWRYTKPRGNQAAALQNPNVGGLFSNRWKTRHGEVGVLVDVVYVKDEFDNPVQWIDVHNDGRVWAVDANGNANPAAFDGATQKFIAPPGTRLGNMPFVGGAYNAGERERPMVHAALAFKPSKNLSFDAQFLYTGYRSRWEADFIFSDGPSSPPATGVTLAPEGPYSETPFGTISPVLTATIHPNGDGVLPYTATSTQAHESKTDSIYGSVGMQWRKDNLSWHSDLALVASTFEDDRIIVDQNLRWQTVDYFTYDDAGHGGFRVTTPTSDTPMKDANQFTLRGLFQSFEERKGTQVAWRNDFTYALDHAWLTSIEAGFRLSSHNATNHSAEGGRDVPDPGNRPSPVQAFGEDFSTLVPGIDRLGGTFTTPNRDYLLDNRDEVRTWYGASAGRLPEDPNRFFDQDENIAAVYLQARYGFRLGTVDIKGAAGVRGINTKRTLRGNSRVGSVVTAFEQDTSEIDVLPSLNSVVSWTDKLQSHFSIGKTIRRPDFAQLNPAISSTPPTINTPGNASGGNADLQPVESISTDVTLEYYFAKSGFVQLALFHRDIDGYIQNFRSTETIDGLLYDVNRPNNSGKGSLKGFEIGVQKFFDFLPGPLSKFGLQANYTRISGKNQFRTTLNGDEFVDSDLPGVAKGNYNVALMYEGHGLTGRLALTHRDAYVEAPRVGFFSYDNWVKASNYVDLSLGYEIRPGLTLQFDALNLTGEDYESYQGDPIRPRDIRYGSRTFLVGMRWKL